MRFLFARIAAVGMLAVCARIGCGADEAASHSSPAKSEPAIASAKSETETEAETDANVDTDLVENDPAYETVSVRGKVGWLSEILSRRFKISSMPSAKEHVLALEGADGTVYPLVEDLRGRSFRTDPQLREFEVELLLRKYRQQPLTQVVRIYQWHDGQKYVVDYWCDICAIIMFERGFCACCQADNRVRKRHVETGYELEVPIVIE